MAVRVTLVAALLAGGCHLLYPHSPSDAGRGEGSQDLAQDLSPGRDASSLDRTGRDDLPPSCQVGRSCKEIRTRCSTAPSGRYEVDPDDTGPVASFEVYCDMEIAGGGWTLAGRSAGSAFDDNFGWRSDTGTIAGEQQPYSIDLVSRQVQFGEVLIGARGAGKVWGANVYRYTVPPSFTTAYGEIGVEMQSISVVKGTCVPDLQNQSMLHYLGCTTNRGWFFIRDHAECENFGLMAHGFSIAAAVTGISPCDRWGYLQNKHGMVFVR